MCVGADSEFYWTVKQVTVILGRSIKIVGHPPTDKRLFESQDVDELWPEKGYLTRNNDIVRESDILIAAPLTNKEVLRSGTWSTVRYAKKLKQRTVILES